MLRFCKHLVLVVLFVLFAGCSGGGCSSGCSCGGITPLAEGFNAEQRIENAASARLTKSGLGFLQQNLGTLAGVLMGGDGGAILSFEVPPTTQDLFIAKAEICPDGAKPEADPPECMAEIDLANAQLQVSTVNPHNISITGPMPFRIQNLPVKVTWGICPLCAEENLQIVLNDQKSCMDKTFKDLDLTVDISIEIDADQAHSRYGYSRMRILDFSVDKDDILAGIQYCGGVVTPAILSALENFLIGFLFDSLIGTLTGQIDDALCQKANPELNPPCPTGTTDVEGVCRYGTDADAACASIVLGLDGNVNMSSLLPAYGAFDILFAAGGHSLRSDSSGYHWGDLNPIAEGGTIGMYGGTEPAPTRACVPLVQAELPKDIPIPDELLENTLADWPADTDGPHLGFALSERFANYALTQMYNSGAFCLGISADTLGDAVPLSTALLSVGLGANSMSELGRQKQPAPVAITLRPQQPPTLVIGGGTDIATDPLLHVSMKQVAFDFYVWSLDRYVRALTATMDLDVPVNLIVTPEGLQPVIDKLGVANTTVTNSGLVREDPAKIATLLEGFIGDMVGSLLGDALPPVDISTMLASTGLELQIPATVEGKGSPGLRKLNKNSDAFLGLFATLAIASNESMAAPSSGYAGGSSETSAQLSELRVDPAGLHLGSATKDNGPRATLQLGSSLDDGSRQIEWQYKLDKGPWHSFTTERSIVVDDGWLRVQGRHVVKVRSRVVGEVYSLDPEPAEVVVWINDTGRPPAPQIDEDGPIGTSSQELRGRNIGDGSGCQCLLNRPSEGGNDWAPWLLLGAIVPVLAARRRRERAKPSSKRNPIKQLLAALGLIAFAGLWAGCSCSSDAEQKPAPGCRGRGDCETLLPGLVGAYTSAAVTPDGTVWVAGYLEGNWEQQYAYGDLVVGRVEGDSVAWEAVDGVPSEPEVDIDLNDPQGLRGGQTEPGEDVGLWTSIAIDSDGKPAVAYYDASNRGLRYAHLEGNRWAVSSVQLIERGSAGRYAKLLFSGGKPVIAYQFSEPGQGGAVRSGVRLATGSSAKTAGQQWAIEDVIVGEATPCRAYLCASGTACVAASGLCADKKNDCAEDCGSDECVAGSEGSVCEPVYGSSKLDTYPEALGLYISAALRPDSSVGLAFYDRINGNLLVATKSGESWTTIIADGEVDGVSTGDKGMAASLAIDAQDNFHLAYVDGLAETLSYQMVAAGTTLGAVQIVDDGMGNADGQHLVGDDAHIIISASGEVRISYQDATAGQLRSAVGAPADTPNSWVVKTITQDGFAGAFSRQVEVGGALKILNWWRQASPYAIGDVRMVTP